MNVMGLKKVFEMFPMQNLLRSLPNATKKRLVEYGLNSYDISLYKFLL